MTYMQIRNKIKQISVHLIVYLIYVFLGSAALVFFYNSWNSTAGHLIIFMSPYLIFTSIYYGYRFWKSKHQDTQEC